jgi:hypothetical protein
MTGEAIYEAFATGVEAAGAVGTVAMGERTVALTGVAALGAVGDVEETNSPIEDGVVAQGQVGLVGSARTVALTGVAASGDVSNVDFAYAAFLSGVEALGNVGNMLAAPIGTGVAAGGQTGTISMGERTVALTGVSAAGAVGVAIPVVGPTEDSVVAFGQVGSIASTSRTVALSGVSARGQAGTPNYFYWTTIDDSGTPNWQNVEMVV